MKITKHSLIGALSSRTGALSLKVSSTGICFEVSMASFGSFPATSRIFFPASYKIYLDYFSNNYCIIILFKILHYINKNGLYKLSYFFHFFFFLLKHHFFCFFLDGGFFLLNEFQFCFVIHFAF